MSISPYAMCPCGSGKQFKWCCQAYFAQIEKAQFQLQKGQLTAAELTLNQLVAKHPRVPQVLGYQAELMFQQGKKAEAETVVREAIKIDSNFGRGHWLLGSMRLDAQDAVGALTSFRKASEAVHPNANEFLSQCLVRVAELEMELVHPVASRVALERAAKVSPNNAELRQAFETSFNEESSMPVAARKEYSFREPKGDKSIRWLTAAEAIANGKFSVVLKAFKDIAIAHPDDAASQFNLGLARAWVGENDKALDPLLKSIELDANDENIAETVGLVEVVRCGAGLEEKCDYVEHSAMFPIRDVKPIGTALGEWEEGGRLSLRKADEEGQVLAGTLLEVVPDLGTDAVAQFAPIQSHVVISQQVIVFSSSRREAVDRSVGELLEKCSEAVDAPQFSESVSRIGETLDSIAVVPVRGEVTPGRMTQELQRRTREYFDGGWLNKPLKSLDGASPADSVQKPSLKKRLPGLIAFIEQCIANVTKGNDDLRDGKLYNFDRLRRKLGLPALSAENSEEDIDSLSPDEAAGLLPQKLSDANLAIAFRSNASNSPVAANFAREAIKRATIADRFPFFNFLINQAIEEGSNEETLTLLKAGTEADTAGNEGRRAADYAIRHAKILAKTGDVEGAAVAFRDAMEKSPDELKLYSPAAEAMLGKRHGKYALEFAEKGLVLARSQSNRDAENQFLELVEAAKKLG